MRPSNENTLPPASLATDGEQGANAGTFGTCRSEHILHYRQDLALATEALTVACAHLQHYGHRTDWPAWQAVDAADLMEAAHALLREVSP